MPEQELRPFSRDSLVAKYRNPFKLDSRVGTGREESSAVRKVQPGLKVA